MPCVIIILPLMGMVLCMASMPMPAIAAMPPATAVGTHRSHEGALATKFSRGSGVASQAEQSEIKQRGDHFPAEALQHLNHLLFQDCQYCCLRAS